MQYLSAECIIPVQGEPCYDSVLAISDNGEVEGIYSKNDLNEESCEIGNYNGILCPGFVNTHCHLELSWVKGLIPEGEGLDQFIWQLEKLKKSVPERYIPESVEKAVSAMEQSGIVATADISNGDQTIDFKSKSNHYFHTFLEVFGSNTADAKLIFEKALHLKTQFQEKQAANKLSIIPHATYSVSHELFRLIAAESKDGLLSIHHQENADENHFFMDGSGPIAARRNAFNPHLPAYKGTGKRPMESIAGFFSTDQKILLVHNTVTEKQDIDFIGHYFKNAYWCFCPNANLFIENRLPDIRLFHENNCTITLGTDSLASNRQLSILEEMKTIHHHFPHLQLNELLRWGTLNGAEFLGLGEKLGSFEKGKKPGVVNIENVNIQTLQLTPESTSRLIIPAGL